MAESPGMTVVVVVDNDEAVRKLMVRILTTDGFRVIEFVEIWQGLSYVEWGLDVDLVITDLNPDAMLTGLDFVRRVHAFRPEVPFLIVTGAPHEPMDEPHTTLLDKPFRVAEFSKVVAECLAGRA